MLIILVPTALILTWLGVFERGGRGQIRLAFVKSLVILFFAVAATTELLSLFGGIGYAAIATVWLVLAFGAFFAAGSDRRGALAAFSKRLRAGLNDHPAFALIVVAIVLSFVLVIALASPPNTYDSQTYHMARVAHWIQNGTAAHYPTVILRQLYQPPLAEFGALHLTVLSGNDYFANLVQWAAFAGCSAAASLIAFEFGLSARFQALAAGLVATLPGAIVQGSSTQNDLVLAFFVLTFFLCFLKASNDGPRKWFVFAGIALGLALMTKGTAYLFCFPIGVYFAVVGFLRSAGTGRIAFTRRVGIVLALALAINFGQYARNTALFGSPVTSGDDDVRNRNVTVRMVLANIARNYAVNLGTKSESLRGAIERGMRRMFGSELGNPNSTWLDNEFKVEYSTHEDLAGNFVHTILITLALPLLIFVARRSDADSLRAVGAAVFTIVLAIVLFSILLKWQIWTARLQLPMMMLGSVVLAYVVAKIVPRAGGPILALTLAASVPFIFFAEPRRVLSNDWRLVLFSETRSVKMFKNLPDAGPLFWEAASVIGNQPEKPGTVGLHIEYNDFDYPLWALLKAYPTDRPTIVHVGVDNVSKTRAPAAAPEYVISTRSGNKIDGVEYAEVWKKDVVRVLRRAR